MSQPKGAFEGDGRITLVGALLCLAGSGIFYLMPGYVGAATRLYTLTASQAGALSGGESLTIGVAALICAWMIGHMDRRLLIACALVTLVGNALTSFMPNFPALMALRLATGFFGEGPLYASSYAVLGLALKPDRAFGCAVLVSAAAGSAALAAQGPLLALGLSGLLLPVILAGVAFIAVAGWLPKLGGDRAETTASPTSNIPALWLLASIAVWFGAPGFFWAFADTIGVQRGVPEALVDQALALSTLIGLVGLLAPVVLADRFGRTAPMILATGAVIASAWLSVAASGFSLLASAVSLFYVAWNVVSVYQLAALSSADDSGRYAGLGATAQLAGLSAGPLIGGLLLDRMGLAAVTGCVAAFAGGGLVCFLAARARSAPVSQTA